MSEGGVYFGIDFGTTNSAMASYDPERGRAEIVLNYDDQPTTPSAVFYAEDGGVLVGQDAINALDDYGSSTDLREREEAGRRLVRAIKRRLVNPPVISLPGGEPVSPVEVVSEILKKLKRDAEEGHFGEEVGRAVITHPAEFDTKEQKVLREAARLAGFGEVALLEEPTAAALAVHEQGQRIGEGLLVYDLGAGTFDLAVVVREEDGSFAREMKPEGDRWCGGEDFDLALYEHCDGVAQEKLGRPVSLTGGVDQAFLAECRKRKENLSRSDRGRFSSWLPKADGGKERFVHEVERGTFEGLIRGRIEETVRKTQSLYEEAGRRGQEVETVVLIGGSSRVPLVGEMLREALPGAEVRDFSGRTHAVALGAAHHAFGLWGPKPTRPPPVEVSDLVGEDASQARGTLVEAGSELDGQREVPSGAESAGLVSEQSPAPGTEADRNPQVDVSTNVGTTEAEEGRGKGASLERAPDLVGRSVPEATDALSEADLTLGTQSKARSDRTGEGRIVGQDPQAGTEVGRGTAVDVAVGAGSRSRVPLPLILGGLVAVLALIVVAYIRTPCDAPVPWSVACQNGPTLPVPNVEGQSKDEAVKILRSAGFEVKLGSQESSEEDTGRVVEQSSAGGKAQKGSRVVIEIGKPSLPEKAPSPEEPSQPAPKEPSRPAPGYDLVEDDSGSLTVEVPPDWEALTGSASEGKGGPKSWSYYAGEDITASITAARSLDVWKGEVSGDPTPGTYVVASRTLAQNFTDEELIYSQLFANKANNCAEGPYEEFDRGPYTVKVQEWNWCGVIDRTSLVVVAAPEGRECVVVMDIVLASETDRRAAQHILDSFEVDCGDIGEANGRDRLTVAVAHVNVGVPPG